MTTKQPILITGAHRSGTTWVGRMLAESPSLYYIHEPFSVTDFPHRGICNVEFKHWFTYITRENEDKYYHGIKNTLNLNYDWMGALKTIHSFSDLKTAISEYQNSLTHKDSRIIVKDPIAFFSAPWLAERFNMKIVVLIRHPAAFASSLIKLNWEHDFADFLAQPLLLKEIIAPFQSQIEEYANNRKTILEQACLLWKIIYTQAFQYQQKYPDWLFIRHEDLSLDPLSGFQKLSQQLGLEFTSKMRSVIEEFSGSQNPHDTDAPVGSETILKRHSQSNILNWKKRLTSVEITKIRNDVENISQYFYTDADW